MTSIPTLTTERLILRAHEADDLPACLAMWSDLRVVRHISGEPSTRSQCWSRLLTYRGLWQFLGYGYWAVIERESGAFVGDIGFADFKREIEPSIEGLAEAGWVLAPHAAGKGYATEAVRGALDWFDDTFGRKAVCIIDPENAPSIRVAEKCGFRHWIDTKYKGGPSLLFERAARSQVGLSAFRGLPPAGERSTS